MTNAAQKTKKFFKELFEIIVRPDMKMLPGQLAFFLALAAFPMLGLLGYIGSFSITFNETFISIINNIFPVGAREAIISFITNASITKSSFLFLVIGFYIASNGTDSLILISNQLYGFKDTGYLRRRLKAIVIIILLMVLFALTTIVLAFGNSIVQILGQIEFFNNYDSIYQLFILAKWPFAFIIFYFTVKLVYILSPDANIKGKYMTKGALFTTIGWIITTALYSFYVTHFTRYDLFYGSLSGIIVMLIWIYFLSIILVIGIAINKSTYDGKIMYKRNKSE